MTGRATRALEVERHASFERLALSASTLLTSAEVAQIDAGVQALLPQVAELCGADRAWHCAFSSSEAAPHSAGAPQQGLEPPLRLPRAWRERLQRGHSVRLLGLGELPGETSEEIAQLLEQGVGSVLLLPVVLAARVVGCIGLHSAGHARWGDDHAALLRAIGESIANALERKRADQERRALEEQLVQARSLENVARLAGGLAHDFNNLLSVISSHAQALERELGDARLKQYARVLCRSAEQAAELTRQLMSVGRRESTPHEARDVNAVLGSLENLLRRTLGERVELDLELARAPCWVKLGKAQLEQVIVNLVMNAQDALPEGGHVRVQTAVAHALPADDAPGEAAAGEPAPGPWAHLSVTDDGVGMTDEVAQRAFEPFFTTKGAAGTGLGLATVRAIIRQAGGRVSIRTAHGAGTRVDVLLPCVPPVAEPPPLARAPLRRVKGESILVVEEAEDLREWLARTLREHGYRARTAADADEAWALLGRGEPPPALLLSDIDLARGACGALAARVRQHHPGVRLAFLSGRGEARAPLDVAEGGGPLLSAPFLEEDLVALVRAALAPEPPTLPAAGCGPAASEPPVAEPPGST